MRTYAAAAIALLAFPAASLQASEWHAGPGIAYVSGIDDLVDRYRANIVASGQTADVDKPIPVGVEFDLHYQWDAGLRVGGGVGPFARLRGSKKHFELPINGTIGYTFLPASTASPYIKAGGVYHFASGDYYSSSTPGVLVAAGLEFVRRSSFIYALELSFDRSKIELDTVCGPFNSACQPGTVTLNSYDTVLSFFVKF